MAENETSQKGLISALVGQMKTKKIQLLPTKPGYKKNPLEEKI